jgi:hypothetical protein
MACLPLARRGGQAGFSHDNKERPFFLPIARLTRAM